jgi:hypothetical protein
MRCSESLMDWKARNEEMMTRLVSATDGLDDQELGQRPDPRTWSPAQVLEHLALAHRPYLQTIQDGLARAKRGVDDPPVRHSFFGKLLISAVGPDSNVPAPRGLHPGANPVWRELYAEWQLQHARLLSLLDEAAGVDLTGAWVRNPFIRVIRQNLADCFEILTAHIERHVGQIEGRVPKKSMAESR